VNKQLYVFLEQDDVVKQGDQWFYVENNVWVDVPLAAIGEKLCSPKLHRRPMDLNQMTVWKHYFSSCMQGFLAGRGSMYSSSQMMWKAKELADDMIKVNGDKEEVAQ
jgi:hypothetical protein